MILRRLKISRRRGRKRKRGWRRRRNSRRGELKKMASTTDKNIN